VIIAQCSFQKRPSCNGERVALGELGDVILTIPLIAHSKVRLFAFSPTVCDRINLLKRSGE
jgi:hypothetical protein